MDINEYLDKSERKASEAASDLIKAGDELDLEYVIAGALVSLAFTNLALAKMSHSRMPAHKQKITYNSVTNADLQRVADIYNTALDNRRPPLNEVVEATKLSRASASRRIRAAKDAGLITAPKGKYAQWGFR